MSDLNSSEKERYQSTPDWLKNLQENAWELELLISGGAVFTLLQLPDYFLVWLKKVQYLTSMSGFRVYLIIGLFGIKILTNGFILHLLLRSYWLAMVCLNSVFPAGLNKNRKPMQFPFKNLHTEGDLQESILKVDRLSGLVIFSSISASILIAVLLLLIALFFGSASLSLDLEETIAGNILEILFSVIIGSGVLYLIDLLGMGFLRRIPIIAVILFPFFSFFDFLSLRKLYERPLYFFGGNIKKGSYYTGAVVFTAITFITVYLNIFRTMHWKNPFDARDYKFKMVRPGSPEMSYRYYADESEPEDRQIVNIPSKIIRDIYLPVNIRYIHGLDQFITASNPVDSLRTMSGIFEISIDDSVIRDVIWYPRWEKDIADIGIGAVILIEDLKNGPHKLKIKQANILNAEYQRLQRELGRGFEIPFWKDVH